MLDDTKTKEKISTGLPGLDEILEGGLIPQKAYLLQGGPGSGKSTIGYHFLTEGLKDDEKVLFITLGESREDILDNATRMNIGLPGVEFLDLSPKDDFKNNGSTYDVFSSADVEQGPIIGGIAEAIEKHQPKRVFLDSITMLRFLTSDPFQMRKMGLSFIRYICNHGATLLMTSETQDHASDKDATFWVDGIIRLEYDPEWRKIEVTKFRGSGFLKGNHAFKIGDRGITVYPRLKPGRYEQEFSSDPVSSGIVELDAMLNGGIEKGTVTIITGPTGVGKTNLGLQFVKEAASRGDRSALYTFEESKDVIVKRSESINVPISEMLESGNLVIKSIDPLSYSPDEFAKMVRTDIEENDTKIVMLDSIGGYRISVREENTLERLHALTVYMQNMGVTCLLLHESKNITGGLETTGMNASYLADNILFLRYLELNGELQKSIGVLKKRLSDFERTIRTFNITGDGLEVGEKLTNLKGILSGHPEFTK